MAQETQMETQNRLDVFWLKGCDLHVSSGSVSEDGQLLQLMVVEMCHHQFWSSTKNVVGK